VFFVIVRLFGDGLPRCLSVYLSRLLSLRLMVWSFLFIGLSALASAILPFYLFWITMLFVFVEWTCKQQTIK